MVIKANLELQENVHEIQRKVIKALKEELDRRLYRLSIKCLDVIKTIIKEGIENQPEYASLDDGKLAANFGFRDGKARIDSIIQYWLNHIVISTSKTKMQNNLIVAGIQIRGLQIDYEDILKLQEASVITKIGQSLPWLEWLLKFGDKSIVLDYDIMYGPIPRSRSGKAIMIHNKGDRWGVPPEFAGTPNNNFVTRAIASVQGQLDAALTDIIERGLK